MTPPDPKANEQPAELPEPCPICGKRVGFAVHEWLTATGQIIGADMGCETEPDIDSDEWDDWHADHYRMPYVDWLPYETRMLSWINRNYTYDGKRLVRTAALDRAVGLEGEGAK